MAYSSGLLDSRAEILQRNKQTAGSRGRGSNEPTYTNAGTVWANVKWTKGMRPLQEGALEAYDVVMIRMRWNSLVDHDCRIRCGGKVYQIIQLNEDKRDNQIQVIAQEVTGKTTIETPTVTITPTTTTPTAEPNENANQNENAGE